MPHQCRLTAESKIARLARAGLARQETVAHTAMRETMALLAGTLGATWQSAGTEAAAGMLLLALARDTDLRQHLNGIGWRLVERFITAHPELASHISPRSMGEIFAHQHGPRAPAAAPC